MSNDTLTMEHYKAVQRQAEPLPLDVLISLAKQKSTLAFAPQVFRALSLQIPQMNFIMLTLTRLKGREAKERQRQLIQLLPIPEEKVWKAFLGQDVKLTSAELDGYTDVLKTFKKYGSDRELARYASLAKAFKPEEVMGLTKSFWDNHNWEALLELYSCVPEGSPLADAVFWCRRGIASYYQRRFDEAKEYFAKADSDATKNDKELFLSLMDREEAAA